jgi:hypothetical protein
MGKSDGDRQVWILASCEPCASCLTSLGLFSISKKRMMTPWVELVLQKCIVLGVAVHDYNPSSSRGRGRRIVVLGQPG